MYHRQRWFSIAGTLQPFLRFAIRRRCQGRTDPRGKIRQTTPLANPVAAQQRCYRSVEQGPLRLLHRQTGQRRGQSTEWQDARDSLGNLGAWRGLRSCGRCDCIRCRHLLAYVAIHRTSGDRGSSQLPIHHSPLTTAVQTVVTSPSASPASSVPRSTDPPATGASDNARVVPCARQNTTCAKSPRDHA